MENGKKLNANIVHCATDGKEDELMRLYLDGRSDRWIANKVGISKATVCRWRNRKGLIPKKRVEK